MNRYVKYLSTSIAATALLLAATSACAQVPFVQLKNGAPLPSDLVQQLQAVSMRDIGKAAKPDKDLLKPVPDTKAVSGEPWVLYIGAEYCPYCAAMRWPLVVALMRFGSFKGLSATRSSSTDVFADTATVSFVDARYTSKWLKFESVETQDRHQRPLQKPSKEQIALLRKYDRKPYTNYPGSIPFLDISNQWIQVGSPFNPGLLKGMDQFEVAAKLDSGKGKLWTAVLGEADQLTAALCKLTKGQPESTCKALTGNN